jgi:hypothetical protein
MVRYPSRSVGTSGGSFDQNTSIDTDRDMPASRRGTIMKRLTVAVITILMTLSAATAYADAVADWN